MMQTKKKKDIATIAAHAGTSPDNNYGIVNPPVYHTSTILRESLDHYRHHKGAFDYGRIGTPTSRAVEQAVAAIYHADDAISVSSGLASVTTAILAVVKTGDEALFPDSIYGSSRRFLENVLPNIGVQPIFYDPIADISHIKKLISDKTSLIYLETPGSLTFEMQDTKALVSLAKESGCVTIADNTWGTAMHYDAFGHGIDIVIEAGTKYISGHSDVSIGFIIANGKTAQQVRLYAQYIGHCVAPDDLYLTLRGLRTMPLRLKESEKNGIYLAKWIAEQPEVVTILHPALPSHPQHHLWQRDFTGSAGLFSFGLDNAIDNQAVDAMINDLAYFGIGDSWGGYESLISEAEVKIKRTVSEKPLGRIIRIYAGIENADDLLDDIKAGFERMRKALK